MAELHVGKAQRKAMHDALDDAIDQLMTLVGVGVGVPEGPPVGTIARRPDGAFVAVRVLAEDLEQYWTYTCVDHSGPDDDWPDRNDADSWPVIFTPGEAVGSGPTTDGGETYDPREGEALRQAGPCQSIDPVSELKCSQTLGHEGNHGTCSGLEWPDPTAQQEPVIRGTVQDALRPDDVALLETDPMEFVRRTQQEPGESLARGLDDIAAGRVSRRDDYLEPQPEPATTHPVSPESTNCVPKPRTPRVVDRLGVDEQGSLWRNRADTEFWFQDECWNFRTKDGCTSWYTAGYEPKMRIFTEILEPRVLPSLDCEEARDGTVWEARYVLLAGRREQTPGWKFQHTQDGWVYEDGSRVLSPEFLTGRGPYTEVLPDVG